MAENNDTSALDEITEIGGRGLYFDADGTAISARTWAGLFSDPSYKILARVQVGDLEVITVWMGTDQGCGAVPVADDPPLIFGTIAWRASTNKYLDDLEVFAATAEQALANHAALAARLRTSPA